jgi:hypothetical protein
LRAGGTISEKSAASVKPFPIGSGVRRVNQCGYVATTHPIILAVPIVYSANLSTAFDANRGAVSRMPTLDHNLTGRWRGSRAKKTTETDRQEASSLAREPELLSDPTTEPHSRNQIDMIRDVSAHSTTVRPVTRQDAPRPHTATHRERTLHAKHPRLEGRFQRSDSPEDAATFFSRCVPERYDSISSRHFYCHHVSQRVIKLAQTGPR